MALKNPYDEIPDDDAPVAVADNPYDSIPAESPNPYDAALIAEAAPTKSVLLPDSIRKVPTRDAIAGGPKLNVNFDEDWKGLSQMAADELGQGDKNASLLGISPKIIPTGAELNAATGIPKIITTPVSGASRAVAGLGQFLTSPEGIEQSVTAAIPGVGLVQRAKWIYDMAKGVGEAGGNLTERLKKFASNPSAATDEDYQGLAEDAANTALMLYGAGKLSSHEVSKLTGVRAPLGRVTETKRARFAKDMAEQLDKEPGNFNPVVPGITPPAIAQPGDNLNAEFARVNRMDETAPVIESVPLDPQTGQPISAARSTLEKADARLAQIAAERERTANADKIQSAIPTVRSETPGPIAQVAEGKSGEVQQPASPQEAGKANAPLDKTSGSEGIAQPPRVESLAERYDRLKAKKAAGKLTDPVEIEQFEAQDKVQKQLAGQAAFAEMKAQLEKNAAKQKADLHARGYNEASQNKMTPEQKVEALKEEIPTPEADARRYWELRDKATLEPDQAKYLDQLQANMAELERIQHRNTKEQGQPPERPADMGPEPVRQKSPPSAVQGTGTPPVVEPIQGSNPPVVGEQPAAPVKPKTPFKVATEAKKELIALMHEWGVQLGFIQDLTRYSEGVRDRKVVGRTWDPGRAAGQLVARKAHESLFKAADMDPLAPKNDPRNFAKALPTLKRLIEEYKAKEAEKAAKAEEQAKAEKAARDAEADAAIDAWDTEVNKPDEPPPAPPGDVGPGLGAAKVEEVAPAGTGLGNAISEIERKIQGFPEAYQKQIRNMPEVWQEAADILAKDPQAGKKLADELKWNPQREMTDTDSALLLRHKVALENAKNQAAEDTITGKTPEARAEAQARFDDLSLQLTDLLDAAKFRGSQWGREGRWRQALAFEDYSLETMVSDKQVELGRKLTPAEHTEVQKMQKRIAELEKQLADKKVKDARGEKAGAVNESVDATVKKAKAQKARDKAAGVERDLAAEEKEALDYLKESFGENGDFRDTQNVIRKLMELLAESGVHERLPMEDAIHSFLQGIDPRITREQAQDLMSNYGKSRLPSQKPSKVIVRDINAQILSVRKLLDYFQGKRPKLTGQLRDVPSQIQRNLLKMVNEAKKNFKLEGPTDSARAIKSALDAVNTRLKNRLADLKQEVVTRRKIIRERTPSPYNEETLRLKREIEEVQKQHDEIFGTEMTDAQRLALAEKSADRQIAELERQIKTGEIFPKSKQEFSLRSEKLDAAKARLEELKLERKFARESSKQGLEPHEAFLLNYQQRLRRMASEYQDRLARGDFEPKPKRVNHPNAETMKLQAKLEKAKLDFRRSVEMDRLNKRTPTEKVLEQISGAARASALSGYHTLAKLAGYSAARLGEIPLREAVGAAIGRVPGFRRIFAGANMESGSTLRSLGKLYSTAATKGMKQAAEIMRKGESADKLLYEKPYITPPRWYDFFGRLHQAEKAPLRAGSQAMYYERAYENAIKQGLDVNDEFVKAQINKEAYDYANREILMENNKFAKIVNAGLGLLEKKNPKTGKVEIQNAVIATLFRTFLTKGIVRTPANYIAQTIARTPIGLTAGLVRAAHGHFKGIDNLHPVEKNAIASLVKVGAVGSAFFLWGMIDATQNEKDRVFGGYYSPGRKKGGRDVDWGKLRVDGTTLPHVVTHNPLTESAQMGSTLMRVFLSRSKKGKDTSTAALDAGVKSLVGLVSKAPITNPIMRLDSEGHRVVGGFLQGLVPQLIQNIAEDTDFNKDGMIERNPQSALDEVSVGIPGLRQTVKKK